MFRLLLAGTALAFMPSTVGGKRRASGKYEVKPFARRRELDVRAVYDELIMEKNHQN